jgi:hypothetical protein
MSNNRDAFLFISREKQSMYRDMSLKPISVTIMYRQLKLDFFPRLLSNPNVTEEDKNIVRVLLERPWNPYIRNALNTWNTLLTKELVHLLL